MNLALAWGDRRPSHSRHTENTFQVIHNTAYAGVFAYLRNKLKPTLGSVLFKNGLFVPFSLTGKSAICLEQSGIYNFQHFSTEGQRNVAEALRQSSRSAGTHRVIR
jgi:hypothetical protein